MSRRQDLPRTRSETWAASRGFQIVDNFIDNLDRGVMRIAVLGLGEAGSLYAEALAASGSHVAGFDPAATPTPAGARRAASVVEAVAEAELVVALTGAAKAVAAAEESAPGLGGARLLCRLQQRGTGDQA